MPNGAFIPILFDTLEKKGNSNTTERKSILCRFCELWQNTTGQKAALLADREFIGVHWFKSIIDAGLSSVIRLRIKDYVKELCSQTQQSAESLQKCMDKNIKRYGFFRREITLNGCKYYYIALPNEAKRKNNTEDKYIALLCDSPNVRLVAQNYRKRWKIEVFFFHIKSNGFHLEDLNFKDLQKVQLMVAIVGVLYSLINRQAIQYAQIIPMKNFKTFTAKCIVNS